MDKTVMKFSSEKDFNELIGDMIAEAEECDMLENAKTLFIASETGGLYILSIKAKDAKAEMILHSGFELEEKEG